MLSLNPAHLFARFDLLAFFRKLRLRLLFPGLRMASGVRVGRLVSVHMARGSTIVIGKNTYISDCVELRSDGRLIIGDNGFIGRGSVIVAAIDVMIGENALIAEYVTIRDQDHGVISKPYCLQPLERTPVQIGSNVWIGAKATILRGINIGDDAVIGAGAVVTRSVAPDSYALGVPARMKSKIHD